MSNNEIKKILENSKTIAMVGVSSEKKGEDPKNLKRKPANVVMKYMQDFDFKVIPVNPFAKGEIINGETVVNDIEDIKIPIDIVDVFRPSKETPGIAKEAAKNAGIEIVDSSYFYHEERLQRVRNLKKNVSKFYKKSDKIGTVGAVALDKMGNISAATSTGGMTNKLPGRVGDSPIIGSGTWAQNGVCGVSSTGHGEYFIKDQVAREVCTRMEYLNQSLSESSSSIINELADIGGSGGLIAIDSKGNISTPFNTKGMIRGSQTNKKELSSEIY